MGLDMYLTRKTYVQNWDHKGADARHTITVKRGGKPHPSIKPERISYVIEEVAYWRKANQIHKWFVDNCQDGKDECQESYVSEEKLQELVALCKQVLSTVETVEGDISEGSTYYPDGRVEHHTKRGPVVAQVAIAAEVLPTQGGFFFGGTDYDEYYLEDLRETIKQLEPVLAEGGDGDFYYRASW